MKNYNLDTQKKPIELATFSQRLCAHIIDVIIIYLIFYLIYFSILFLSKETGSPKSLANISFIFAIFYRFFSDSLNDGQSLGKRIMGISVVDTLSKRPCTIMKSFIRNVSLSLLGVIDLIFIFSIRRQRLGDIIANTIVIKKN
ncbi:MAG: RDD family protein [Rivularia sp. (in: cyanobacteria)]